MATVFTPSGRMSVRSSPFGGSSNPFTSSGKSSGGSSSSGGGSRSSSGNKISENLMSTKEGVVDIRTGKVIAPIGTSVGEANRLASAAFAIQQKATADKKIADQLAVKQATDAATAQSESNLSRTIGWQLNEAKKDFNKTGQIQELGSPKFKPSEINFGAITNQVGLPSNQPTTYGTI